METHKDDQVPGARIPPDPRVSDDGATGPAATTIRSEVLLAGRRELIIRHGEESYRLRLTGNNKLILTK